MSAISDGGIKSGSSDSEPKGSTASLAAAMRSASRSTGAPTATQIISCDARFMALHMRYRGEAKSASRMSAGDCGARPCRAAKAAFPSPS